MTSNTIYFVQIAVMLITLGMIITARRRFNGFAMTFFALGVMLVIMRIDKATGAIGEPGMSIETSLAVAFFCYQAWLIWKDRRDHSAYLNWREQQAEELKLINEWRERKRKLAEREAELDRLWNQAGADSWDLSPKLAKHTRDVEMNRRTGN